MAGFERHNYEKEKEKMEERRTITLNETERPGEMTRPGRRRGLSNMERDYLTKKYIFLSKSEHWESVMPVTLESRIFYRRPLIS